MTHQRPPGDVLSVILPGVVLLLAGALAALPLVLPAAPTSRDVGSFSAARAFEHIGAMAREPRPIGSAANERARADIVERLHLLGLMVELQTVRVRDYYSRSGGSVAVVNVMARIPGTAPTKAVALIGHYDTIPGSPGANDDASAVAIMVEASRALLAGPRLRNDVILLFTDGEEPAPRFGSTAFVAEHPWAADVGFVINLEAVGAGGPSLLAGVGGAPAWAISQYAAAVPYPAAFSLVTTTTELIGGSNTDFSTFRAIGAPGVEFAYLHGSPIYHTPADAPERVGLRSLHQQGANTLALTRHVGNLDLGISRDDSRSIFFTFARLFVVRYPASWALPIVLVAGMVLAIAGWRERAWLRALQSSGATLVTLAVAALAAAGIWIGLASWRSAPGIAESYAYLAGFVLLSVGIAAAVARVARRHIPVGADALGTLLVWWALGLIASISAPGMSYLFAWPTLAGGLVLTTRPSLGERRWPRLVGWALAASTTLVLLLPAVDVFFQLAQPRPGNPDSQALPFVAVPVLLVALSVELLRALHPRPSPRHFVQQR